MFKDLSSQTAFICNNQNGADSNAVDLDYSLSLETDKYQSGVISENALFRKYKQAIILERSNIEHLKSRLSELERKTQIQFDDLDLADDPSHLVDQKYYSQLQKERRNLNDLLAQSRLLCNSEIQQHILSEYSIVNQNVFDVKNYITVNQKLLKEKQDAIHEMMNSKEYEESQKQKIIIENLRKKLNSLVQEGFDLQQKQKERISKLPEIELLNQKVEALQKKLNFLQSQEREKRSQYFSVKTYTRPLRTKSRRGSFSPKITIPTSTSKKVQSQSADISVDYQSPNSPRFRRITKAASPNNNALLFSDNISLNLIEVTKSSSAPTTPSTRPPLPQFSKLDSQEDLKPKRISKQTNNNNKFELNNQKTEEFEKFEIRAPSLPQNYENKSPRSGRQAFA